MVEEFDMLARSSMEEVYAHMYQNATDSPWTLEQVSEFSGEDGLILGAISAKKSAAAIVAKLGVLELVQIDSDGFVHWKDPHVIIAGDGAAE